MKTYNLIEAAALLHMSPSALRAKVKSGLIRGAKPGKRWVFTETALLEFLGVQADVVLANASKRVVEPCRSTSEELSGGFASRRRSGKEYVDRLALETKRLRRNSTTH